MDCFAFQTDTAVIEATASFKHFRFAFSRTISDHFLSHSLVLVMDLAIAFIDLLMSSDIPIQVSLSSPSLTGMVICVSAAELQCVIHRHLLSAAGALQEL